MCHFLVLPINLLVYFLFIQKTKYIQRQIHILDMLFCIQGATSLTAFTQNRLFLRTFPLVRILQQIKYLLPYE